MPYLQKRRFERYAPELGTVALISIEPDGEFRPTFSALVLDEAVKGCHLVMPLAEAIEVGTRLRILVRGNAPLLAEIKWRTILDDRVMRIGLMFLD